jgi:hypothetical protein
MASLRKPAIHVFDEHQEAFFFWHKARNDGDLREPLDLFHIDAHDDMSRTDHFQKSVYSPVKPGDPGYLEYYREFSKSELDISNFIRPAVLGRLVRNVYFIFPGWRTFKPGRTTTNICSAFGEGKIIKHGLDIKKDIDPRAGLAYPDLTTYLYSRRPLEKIPKSRRVILDIDLDYFACRDSILNYLEFELEITKEQSGKKEPFLEDPTLRFSGLEFRFMEKDGRNYVRIGHRKTKEKAHLPPREEIGAEIAATVQTLRGKKTRPAVVTLCRSCISGYCPREYSEFIEGELLRLLGDWLG